MSEITVNGKSLKKYLDDQENEKIKDLYFKDCISKRKSIYHKIRSKKSTTPYFRSGKVKQFTEQEIMMENIKEELKKTSTITEAIIVCLINASTINVSTPGLTTPDVQKLIQENSSYVTTRSGISSILSRISQRQFFRDCIKINKNQIPFHYKWVGEKMSLKKIRRKLNNSNVKQQPKRKTNKSNQFEPIVSEILKIVQAGADIIFRINNNEILSVVITKNKGGTNEL